MYIYALIKLTRSSDSYQKYKNTICLKRRRKNLITKRSLTTIICLQELEQWEVADHFSVFIELIMNNDVVLFQFVILICLTSTTGSGSSELLCSDKRAQTLLNYESTRRNFYEFNTTTLTCHINYFDVKSISNATFNIISNIKSRKLLKKLDLSANGIAEINTDSFNQFVSLENLNIARNFLIRIESHFFNAGLRELCSLNLSSNLIRSVDEMSFRRLESLLWLSLADNCLVTLTLYLPIRALDTLNLSWNFLETFPHLKALDAIHTLDLSHNTEHILNSAENFTSQAIRSVNALNIADNRLSNLHQLELFSNLVELNIANNPIVFDEGLHLLMAFDSMRDLQRLNLTSTNLTTMEFDEIISRLNCNHLTELSIDRNAIEVDFPDFIMMKCTFSNLQHLRFTQQICRQYENFYHRVKLNFPKLRRVEIDYVDANCNCALENREIFSYFHIENSVNWSHVCSKGHQQSLRIVEETYRLTLLLVLLISRLISLPMWTMRELNWNFVISSCG